MEPLETGKIKSEFLERILGKIEITDKRVVVGPGIGEDAAAIDMGERYLIVKSDPITFVSDRIGRYVVNVNANDIAAMGGTPKWFLVTMLLPERRTTVGEIESIMKDLRESCGELGVTLVGGHTEITHGLEHPILSGTMLGEAGKEDLVKNGNIGEGDLLYMTRGVAIEATAIIAQARRGEVIGGFGEAFYRRCIGFLEKPGISVVRDAAKARSSARVTGMHDPTEGGILTGAYEMARGSGMGLTLFLDRIPVYEETSLLCGRFGISPYGSIASGSLLIAVSKGEGEALERAFDGMPPLNAVSRGAGGRSHGGSPGAAGSYTVEPLPYLNLVGEFTRKGGKVRLADGEEIKPSGIDEITKLL
jgi:hydrogenase maturation factor